jgi:hypothetical protein
MTVDALILPETLKKGATQIERIDSILAIAEPLLGVDRKAGQRAYIRRQPGGRLFVSKSPEDTLCHPREHPREGQPRYDWETAADGFQYGYLTHD